MFWVGLRKQSKHLARPHWGIQNTGRTFPTSNASDQDRIDWYLPETVECAASSKEDKHSIDSVDRSQWRCCRICIRMHPFKINSGCWWLLMRLLMSVQKNHSKHEYISINIHLAYFSGHFMKQYETVRFLLFVLQVPAWPLDSWQMW